MWTREQAERVCRDQAQQARAMGRIPHLKVVGDDEKGYSVDGTVEVDADRDPIWGGIPKEL